MKRLDKIEFKKFSTHLPVITFFSLSLLFSFSMLSPSLLSASTNDINQNSDISNIITRDNTGNFNDSDTGNTNQNLNNESQSGSSSSASNSGLDNGEVQEENINNISIQQQEQIPQQQQQQQQFLQSPQVPSQVDSLQQQLPPSCGQMVQGNVKLISNLICDGDGLIVGRNNTVIDLNGFSIKGPGLESNKVGIMIAGQDNVTISGNGIISGFQSGVYVSGSNQISSKYLNLNYNKVGLYITGTRDSGFMNNMINNNTVGVAVHSSNNTDIIYNQLSDNKLSGITFINTGSSLINGNNILNTSNGIFMDTQSSFNEIDFNNVFNNILDINNANNLPININNNLYSNNNCITSLPSGLCIGR